MTKIGPGEIVYFQSSAEEDLEFTVRVLAAGPPQPPAPPVVQVRAYSQRDPRYADEVYAGGITFRSAGCLVVDVAMIASLVYQGEPLTYPPEVARKLREAGAFSGALLSHPARIPQAYDRLHWGGVIHWRTIPARLDVLADEIIHFGATIAEVKFNPSKPLIYQEGGRTRWNQHFVVVEAVDVAGDDAAIVDPWDGQRKLLSQSAYAEPMGWGARKALYGLRLVRAE